LRSAPDPLYWGRIETVTGGVGSCDKLPYEGALHVSLSQDKLLTIVDALIAAVRNSDGGTPLGSLFAAGHATWGVGGVQLAFTTELRIQSSALM
jgi:hypothetical protein